MRTESDDWGVGQDGDEDLGLEKLIGAGDFEGSSEPGQTSWQGVKNLVEDHLPRAVVLHNKNRPKHIYQRSYLLTNN